MKKIAILGSTGSIGRSLLNLIKKDKKNFKIILLTANRNYKKLFEQANEFKVKNLIITDKKIFFKIQNKSKFKKKYNIFNDYNSFNKIFTSKVDYLMSSITGIDGLVPTFKSIKFTKKIAIANKESIICGWNILDKQLKKNKTSFVPVDSEHFSIWSAINDKSKESIDSICITASGGPFYNLKLSKFNKIRVEDAINHPNWKMGKKISVDSSTMMNKVFEIIEARNIFQLNLNQLRILVHKNSYLHAIINYKNNISNLIVHPTSMEIPIFGTLYNEKKIISGSNKLYISKLNNLQLEEPDKKKFPLINLIKFLPKKYSLFETVIVSLNDTLVELFLDNKISYLSIQKIFFQLVKNKDLIKYKKKQPKTIEEILKLNKYVQTIVKSRYIKY